MIYALIILNLAGALTWTGYVWISGIMEPGPADTATLCAGALLLAVAIIVLPIAVFLMFESWALQLKSRQAHHDMISDIKDDLPSCLHRLITLHPDKGFNIGFSRKGVYVHVADPVDRCSIDFPHLDPEEEQNLLALMKKAKKKRYWLLQRLALASASIEIYLRPPSNHQILKALVRKRGATGKSRRFTSLLQAA